MNIERFKVKKATALRRCVIFVFFSAYCLLPTAFCLSQEVVDRMVAVVNGRELVTRSDLLWQLALEPGTSLENPRTEDLQRALSLVVDQRLIAQEAEKLPTIAPTDQEIAEEIKDLISRFSSHEEFYNRLRRVGLFENSEQLREIIRQRVAINNYVEFRFRAFTVVTPEEVADYYRDSWAPRRRRQSPGGTVPSLQDAYQQVERDLREDKVGSDVDEFLEDTRTNAEIVILDPALADARPD